MRVAYHSEIKYVQGKYNYVADQLSRPVRIVQRCLTTTILDLISEEFIKCQREVVNGREMIEYLEGGPIPTKKYHKTILEQFTLKDEILYYVKEASDGSTQYTLAVPHSLKQKALSQAHEQSGHLVQKKTIKKLKNCFTGVI